MKKYVCLLIVCLFVIVVTACSNEGKLCEFQKEESVALKKNIDTLLRKLHYKGYQILVFPHATYSGPELSKKINIERFEGPSFVPEGPAGRKRNLPPGIAKQIKEKSIYYKRKVVVNYDKSRFNLKYMIEYFSVVVVFEEIAAAKRLFLKRLIRDSVLNENRNDRLRIVSKK